MNCARGPADPYSNRANRTLSDPSLENVSEGKRLVEFSVLTVLVAVRFEVKFKEE
jgi:hypothetical protein